MIREIISKNDLPDFEKNKYTYDEIQNNEIETEFRDTKRSIGKYRNIQPYKADNYSIRLMKYIPSEVIALYLALEGVLKSSNQTYPSLHWAIFIFGIIVTSLYLWRIQRVSKKTQLLISTLAYCIWVFALGGPFNTLSWYQPIYGALLLPSFTFLIPIIDAKK